MRKTAFLFILLTTLVANATAQIFVSKDGNVYDERVKNDNTESVTNTIPKKQSFDFSKMTFGGGLGFQFGDHATSINIAPQVGYQFSKYFTFGAGVGYTLYKEKYYMFGDKYNYSASYFGMNVFGRFYPIEYLVLSLQPEANRMWKTVENKSTGEKYKDNKFVASVLVGGGIRLGGMTALIQYDVVQDKDSPYGNDIFYSIGYSFNF